MTTGSVIVGSGVSGPIVCGPAPAMLKLTTSGTFALRFADRIACRSEPAPLSLVLVTTKVAPGARPGPSKPEKTAIELATQITRMIRFVFIGFVFQVERPRTVKQHKIQVKSGDHLL